MADEMKTGTDRGFFEGEAFRLLLLSSITSLWAFLYELGLCHGFGLPSNLVSISPEGFLLALSSIAVIFACVYVMTLMQGLLDANTYTHRSRHLFEMVSVVVLSLAIAYAFGVSWKSMIILAVLAGFLYALTWPPAESPQDGAAEEQTPMERSSSLLEKMLPPLPEWLNFIVLSAAVGGFCCYYAGAGKVFGTRTHGVISLENEKEKCVVAKKYGDFLVCVPINQISRELSSRYVFVKYEGTSVRQEEFQGGLRENPSSWPF